MLVITDCVMPDVGGFELCQHIRAAQSFYVYIIMVTSMAETGDVVKGLAAGADDYLTKPYHVEELLARVRVGMRLIDLHRQLEEKNRLLEHFALTDPLTSLPNRRAIEAWAAHELPAALRHSFSFWVVLVDLDHFKRVNDAHGHEAGDTVLKAFGEILKSNTRSSDISGRIGGEEFLHHHACRGGEPADYRRAYARQAEGADVLVRRLGGDGHCQLRRRGCSWWWPGGHVRRSGQPRGPGLVQSQTAGTQSGRVRAAVAIVTCVVRAW